MKSWNENAAIRSALRRIFVRSPVIWEVMKKARKEFPKFNKDGKKAKKNAVKYLCNICKKYIGSTMISVDHIIPVISVEEGFIDWNTFIHRLFCGSENLQVICDDCHLQKTRKERNARTRIKDNADIDLLLEKKDLTKKDLKKYLSKTKPQEIRDRAISIIKRLGE